jgi:DNA-binding SARP family transcriptional activator
MLSILGGALSAVALLALLIAPPIALVRLVGWPLPSTVPTLHALTDAARSGVSDQAIVHTLAVLAWLAWAQIALALIAEIAGVVRGRPAVHLPVLPGMQAAAARLVAGVLMLATSAHPSAAMASPQPVVRLTPVVQTASPQPAQVARVAEPAIPPRSAPMPSVPAPTVEVQRHDSYWAIAERTLGDGLRWQEIRDLNVGRTMADGYVINPSSELLRPGWTLQLPSDGTATSASSAPRTRTDRQTVTVSRGDSLWGIAEEQVTAQLGRPPSDSEVRPYWDQLVAVNRSGLAHPDDPSLVYAGQTIVLPSSGRPEPERTSVPAPTPPKPRPAPSTHAPDPPRDSSSPAASTTVPASPPTSGSKVRHPDTTSPRAARGDEADDSSTSSVPIALALAGLTSAALAVGAKRSLERRRRRYALDHPGRTSPPTQPSEQDLHRHLVALADENALDDLRSAVAQLAQELAQRGQATRPRLVLAGDDRIEAFMDPPAPTAPNAWTVDGGGAIWTHERRGMPVASDICAAPLLVSIGQPEDGRQLYLDLEAEGLVSLVGDVDTARATARSIITEVALSPLSDTVRVIVVGDLVSSGASTLDHVVTVDDWAEAAEDLCAWAEQSSAVVEEHAWPNTFVGRGEDPDEDGLAAVLVVASKSPATEVLDVLRAKSPASLALVVSDRVDGTALTIDCQPDSLTIEELDLTCVPQELDQEVFESLLDLLGSAEHGDAVDDGSDDDEAPTSADGGSQGAIDLRDPVTSNVEVRGYQDDGQPQLFEPAVGAADTAVGGGGQDEENSAEPEYDVLVRLLGDIQIDGGKPLRPKPTAVVAYIALHGSVTVEALEDACWADPSSGSLRKRLKDVMSECRAGIGSQHLPASAGGRYCVGPRVMTDTQLFDLRVGRAEGQPPDQAADTYRSALGLIRGKVFTYPSRAGSSYSWIDLENLVSQWEVRIATVTHRCVAHLLEAGRSDEAASVAREVLQALPLDTSLTEDLMTAHAASGDLGAVETVYRAHCELLQLLHHADPEPSTDLVRRRLLSKPANLPVLGAQPS